MQRRDVRQVRAHARDRRIEAQRLRHHRTDAGGLHRRRDAPRAVEGRRERLLEQEMLARGTGRVRNRGVENGRHDGDDRVDRAIVDERAPVVVERAAVRARDRVALVTGTPAHRDEPRVVDILGEMADVAQAVLARADDADAERLHPRRIIVAG